MEAVVISLVEGVRALTPLERLRVDATDRWDEPIPMLIDVRGPLDRVIGLVEDLARRLGASEVCVEAGPYDSGTINLAAGGSNSVAYPKSREGWAGPVEKIIPLIRGHVAPYGARGCHVRIWESRPQD